MGATTAAVMASHIKAAGVSQVYAYPGDPIIDLMEELRLAGMEVVLARREGTAAFMAEGSAMATGQLGVVVSTLGPGSTALVNGVAAATWDRVPMLAVSGQIDTGREQVFTHQVVDHGAMFAPVTKWAGRMETKAASPTMRKALRIATAERPGAVHLSCAEDMFRAEAASDSADAGSAVHSIGHRLFGAPGGPSDPDVMLRTAGRPVVVAGIGALRAGATDALVSFAEHIGLPVVVSPMAKGVFPEDHPMFAGVLDMACNRVVWELLHQSDLIVAAGFDCVELIKPWNVSAPVLHIDSTPNLDQIYKSPLEIVGDISLALESLISGWHGSHRWEETEVEEHRRRLRDAYYAGRVHGVLNPTDVIDSVREALPERTLATCDVGSHKLLVGQGWRTPFPRGLLMSNGLSSMGFGVPAAVAVSLAEPGRPVVGLVGDGGFSMASTEMRLAAARNLPLLLVVFCDGSLNRIELKQMARGIPSTATRIEDIDLVAHAESMGCDGARVATREQLDAVLSGAGSLVRPLIVEAQIDPAQYESQF